MGRAHVVQLTRSIALLALLGSAPLALANGDKLSDAAGSQSSAADQRIVSQSLDAVTHSSADDTAQRQKPEARTTRKPAKPQRQSERCLPGLEKFGRC